MSQTVKTPPAAAPSEASNRVTLGLSNRLLARPEVGALVAAIVIFIFFLIVAPSFRSAPSFFTVLYQASTIGIVAVAVGMLMIGGEFDLSAGVLVTTAVLFNAHVLLPARHQPVGRCPLVADPLPGHRISQRLSGDANRDSIVPDNPGHLLHSAGGQPRRDQAGHRIGVVTEHQPDGRLCVAQLHLRAHLPDRPGRVEHHRSLVARLRRRCPRTSCSGPRSATGSTPWAGTPRRPARSVCRSPGSRSACS